VKHPQETTEHKFVPAPGDYVLYKSCGICRIDEIRRDSFGGDEERDYYVLSSVNDSRSSAYIPVGSPVAMSMQRLLKADEIHEAIRRLPDETPDWITESRARNAAYTEILNSGDRCAILGLLSVLTDYKREQLAKKRKFYSGDEKLLTAAAKLITDEFSFVLGIPKNEVVPYIKKVAAQATA